MTKPEVKLKELSVPTGNELATLVLEVVKGTVSIEVYLAISKDHAGRLADAMRLCDETYEKLIERQSFPNAAP